MPRGCATSATRSGYLARVPRPSRASCGHGRRSLRGAGAELGSGLRTRPARWARPERRGKAMWAAGRVESAPHARGSAALRAILASCRPQVATAVASSTSSFSSLSAAAAAAAVHRPTCWRSFVWLAGRRLADWRGRSSLLARRARRSLGGPKSRALGAAQQAAAGRSLERGALVGMAAPHWLLSLSLSLSFSCGPLAARPQLDDGAED